MRGQPLKMPRSRWQRGQLLRLKNPVCGIREGWFAFIEHRGAIFKVCRLGEDESGDMCETDEVSDVHIDFAECFTAAIGMGRI